MEPNGIEFQWLSAKPVINLESRALGLLGGGVAECECLECDGLAQVTVRLCNDCIHKGLQPICLCAHCLKKLQFA